MKKKDDPLTGVDAPAEVLRAARELGALSAGVAPSLEELEAGAGLPRVPEDPAPRPPVG